MDHRTFVGAAYLLVFGVLIVYWRRIERGIKALERPAPAAGAREPR